MSAIAPVNERYISRYTELAQSIREAGLLRRRRVYYWSEIGIAVGSFAGIWVGFALLGHSWFQLLLAGALGIVVTQFGFLGHDASHRQMFDSASWNAWTARVLAGAFAGLSFAWWRTKHNLHHKGPNRASYDPDIAPGAIAFTPDVVDARTGFSGWLAHRQGWFFFPLLTLEGVNLHISSVRATLDRSSRQPWRRLELVL
ncbi:MAG: acyl-CoA desaturase, partial [Marmoricola sp.]|nr:acyl-CoA desaturase [Marmoricola sp.]